MDRISGLSDDLLVKILLFVPTKVAVSTSILSKRWKYLWMWLPKLDYRLSYCPIPKCEMLECFLDRNMPLHRAPVLESFRLVLCCSFFRAENINMWVLTAVSHCLRELEILYESFPGNPMVLPSNLYTCKSLVVLKLEGEILMDVPRMVSLPSLKTLKLVSVRFLNGETLQRLLPNCPALEDLVVDLRESFECRVRLYVVVPSLQRLSLYTPDSSDIDGYVIKTPALKYFQLLDHSYNSRYCLIEHMPDLIEAHLHVELAVNKSLIRSITSVKRLTICSQAMLDESFVFNQLEHLEVCLCRQYFSNQIGRLLKSSSNLQGLHLFFMRDHEPEGLGIADWNQPSPVPECMLSSLQTLSWLAYTGEPQERDVVVYILKHALHLKTATIKSTELDVPRFEMLQELALSPRASAACQLKFE